MENREEKEEVIPSTPRSVSRSRRDLDVRICQAAEIPESAVEVLFEPDL